LSNQSTHQENLSFEIRRKLFHVSTGTGLLLLIEQKILGLPHLALMVFVVFISGLLLKKIKNPLFQFFLDLLERQENQQNLPLKGVVYFLLGIALSLILFPQSVALAALLILIVGDAVSNLVGRRFGKVLHPFSAKKCIEGNLAGAICGGIAAAYFLSPLLVFPGAFVALFVEGIDFLHVTCKIDDNLTVPLTAGFVIQLLTTLT
jgi:dolichol kinase